MTEWRRAPRRKSQKICEVVSEELVKRGFVVEICKYRWKTAYVAVRDSLESPVYCLIVNVIVPYRIEERNEILYRVLQEHDNPKQARCPRSVLKRLDPPRSKRGAFWRGRALGSLDG